MGKFLPYYCAYRAYKWSPVQVLFQLCFLFSVIMACPDDKSMTKIGGDVHIPVTSERYTTATESLKKERNVGT
jgi:hypothetical protein